MTAVRAVKSERERLRDAVSAAQNGHRERGPIAVLGHDERANEGNPEIVQWCPACEERTVPMRDGTCGFCEGPLEDLPAEEHDEWPQTEKVVRRRVAVPGTVTAKSAEVQPAHGPILARATKRKSELSSEEQRAVAAAKRNGRKQRAKDPRRSPILDLLERGPSTATRLADTLGRAPGNVATRLRQLEEGGFVRRTGRSLPGGRGGPQIEWELASEHKEPTTPETPLDTPRSTTDFRLRYFNALLAKIERDDCPEHIFDRVERLCGLGGVS